MLRAKAMRERTEERDIPRPDANAVFFIENGLERRTVPIRTVKIRRRRGGLRNARDGLSMRRIRGDNITRI